MEPLCMCVMLNKVSGLLYLLCQIKLMKSLPASQIITKMNPATRQLISKAFGFNGGLGSELYEKTVGSLMFAGSVAGAYLGYNYDREHGDEWYSKATIGGACGALTSGILVYSIPHMHPVTIPVCVAGVLVANRIKRV